MYHKVWKCISDGVLVYSTRVYVAPTKVTSGAIVCLFGTAVPVSLSTWHFNLAPKLQPSSVSKLHRIQYTLSCTRHSFGNFNLQCQMSRMSGKERPSPKTWLFSCPGPASAEDAPPAELSDQSEWLLTEWLAVSDSPSIHLPNCAARVNLRRLQVRIVGVYK